MEIFVEVARRSGFTAAAKRLNVSKSHVSKQIDRLEERLGVRLLHRTTREVALTEAGETFRTYVEEALSRLEDGQVALDELIGLQRGALSVGGGATATTYLLPRILGRFHEENPGIRFFVREQSSQESILDVLSGELDLGIVTLPVKTLPQSRVGAAKLEVQPWVEDELRLIVPPEHPLYGSKNFEWAQLDKQPLVLFEAGSAVRAIIDRRVTSAGIDVDIVMELRAIESIKQMVAQGIGAGFVSQYALARPDLGLRCIDQPILRRLAVIYREDRTQSPAARAFLEMLEEADRGR